MIATCDTYNNVNRFLSRKALSEFEMRVLFQMSANDSASLIDTPKASTLGLHRALFYNEQEGYLEVFRLVRASKPCMVGTGCEQFVPAAGAALRSLNSQPFRTQDFLRIWIHHQNPVVLSKSFFNLGFVHENTPAPFPRAGVHTFRNRSFDRRRLAAVARTERDGHVPDGVSVPILFPLILM